VYNIETVMAEKLETILRRNVLNTRPRDFYDIYILAATQTFDTKLFAEAMAATAAHRGTTEQVSDVPGLLHTISESKDLQTMWQNISSNSAMPSTSMGRKSCRPPQVFVKTERAVIAKVALMTNKRPAINPAMCPAKGY
jgi:hypothetical protein